jgi:hypothetical protein
MLSWPPRRRHRENRTVGLATCRRRALYPSPEETAVARSVAVRVVTINAYGYDEFGDGRRPAASRARGSRSQVACARKS